MVTRLPRVVVAAPASGQGKTTVATGLMAALRARGLAVSGHKVGPDYIDPGYHALATGRPGRNLDPHLQDPALVAPLLAHGAARPVPADLAVIEGVLGLHDGALGRDGFASTAHVAALVGAPVILVVDVSAAGRSVAAVVHGFATYAPPAPAPAPASTPAPALTPRLAGVILNQVGSPAHEAEVRAAVATTGVPVLGALRRDPDLRTPSRHLGLVPAAEQAATAARTVELLGAHVARSVDLAAVVTAARQAPDLPGPAWDPAAALGAGSRPAGPEPVVAVAGGPAFTFRYAETDELLAAAGVRTVAVDPVRDEALPTACAGLYLGGGFPEVYAAELSTNATLRGAVAAAAAAGMPIVAECAGLLYLCRRLDGRPMVAAIDADATMTTALTLGYRTGVAPGSSVVAGAGAAVAGHEFHRTRVTPGHGQRPAWELRGTDGARVPHGFVGAGGSLHAAYLHVHWAGHPSAARRFAAAARRFAGARS
ncbi:MAG: cobyrinate a,c-diamide synthase [Micromonosporaceae bacterium]|nr:cobyrinate a,c-diamide synthase [Micromonosporaceae bacterium]